MNGNNDSSSVFKSNRVIDIRLLAKVMSDEIDTENMIKANGIFKKGMKSLSNEVVAIDDSTEKEVKTKLKSKLKSMGFYYNTIETMYARGIPDLYVYGLVNDKPISTWVEVKRGQGGIISRNQGREIGKMIKKRQKIAIINDVRHISDLINFMLSKTDVLFDPAGLYAIYLNKIKRLRG